MVRKQFDRAEELLCKARDANPKEAKFWSALASLAERQGQTEKARKLLEKGQQQAGDAADLRLAWVRYWTNHPGKEGDTGLAKLAEGLEKFSNADQTRLLQGLAAAFYRLGNLAAADDFWSRLAQQPSYENNLAMRRFLFELALQRGDPTAMDRRLDDVQRVEGGPGPMWRYSKATRLIWSGRQGNKPDLEEARILLDKLAADRPEWAVLPVAKGEIEDLLGYADAAIANYRRAITLGERSTRVTRRLIQLLSQQQRYKEAANEIAALEKDAPISTDLQRLTAVLSLQNQDSVRAVEQARQTVAVDSRDYRDFLFLG
jgi:lipopolysaccharide biosynthesis regulator YciM